MKKIIIKSIVLLTLPLMMSLLTTNAFAVRIGGGGYEDVPPIVGVQWCECPDGWLVRVDIDPGSYWPGCGATCEEYGHGAPSTPEPDPTSDTSHESETSVCNAMPSLANFTTESSCSQDEISLTFTPNGRNDFVLHVTLKNENGRDSLAAWCTGDAALCKTVGNGKECIGADYTGSNTWCYQE